MPSGKKCKQPGSGPGMLVVHRKPGEIIDIGDSIEVHVVELKGGGMRIGIVAPPNVVVLRRELRGQVPKGKDHGQRAAG